MPLFRIAYISEETRPFLSTKALAALVEQAHKNNVEREISGAIVRMNGWFYQVLEGEQESIAQLLAKIERDDRHCFMTVVARERITERMFKNWGMYRTETFAVLMNRDEHFRSPWSINGAGLGEAANESAAGAALSAFLATTARMRAI